LIKFLHLALTLLLAYTAYLQFNDPDPLFWVTLYTLAAAVPLAALLNIRRSTTANLTGIAAGFCLAGVALTLSGGMEYLDHISNESLIQDMSPFKPYIEEARELIGTVFALAVVLGYWLKQRGWTFR